MVQTREISSNGRNFTGSGKGRLPLAAVLRCARRIRTYVKVEWLIKGAEAQHMTTHCFEQPGGVGCDSDRPSNATGEKIFQSLVQCFGESSAFLWPWVFIQEQDTHCAKASGSTNRDRECDRRNKLTGSHSRWKPCDFIQHRKHFAFSNRSFQWYGLRQTVQGRQKCSHASSSLRDTRVP